MILVICMLFQLYLIFLTVPNDPRRVIVQKLAVLVEGKSDVEIDLTGGSYFFNFVKLCTIVLFVHIENSLVLPF